MGVTLAAFTGSSRRSPGPSRIAHAGSPKLLVTRPERRRWHMKIDEQTPRASAITNVPGGPAAGRWLLRSSGRCSGPPSPPPTWSTSVWASRPRSRCSRPTTCPRSPTPRRRSSRSRCRSSASRRSGCSCRSRSGSWAILAILLFSYRQTIRAYPSAGGAYIVTKDNFGLLAAQIAGVALLTDYVLTVSVSVAAGVAAITSAAPGLCTRIASGSPSSSSGSSPGATCAACATRGGCSRCPPTSSS